MHRGYSSAPIQVVDSGSSRLAAHAVSNDWKKIVLQTARDFLTEVRSKARKPAGELQGEAAANYLAELVPIAEQAIMHHHSTYGSVRWLWYLRRSPDAFFFGDYGTTQGYDRALGESLSWYMPALEERTPSEAISFDTGISSFRHLVRFIARVRLLSQLHQWYRRVGKGAVFDLVSADMGSHIDEELDRAIHLYDARNDRVQQISWSGLGLVGIDADAEALRDLATPETDLLLMTFRVAGSIPMPATYPDGEGGYVRAQADVRYVPKLANVRHILTPLGKASEFALPYLEEVAPVVQLQHMLPSLFSRFPWTFSSTLQHGYFCVQTSALQAACDECLPKICDRLRGFTREVPWATTHESWKRQIDTTVPSLWPLKVGGILRHIGSVSLVDVNAACLALLQRVEFERSPALGNIRAKEFELQCQEIVDSSPWRPPAELAAYRGRELRKDGATLTDIDAIGAKGNALLVISCKSLIYDREYDKGTFRVVRNVQGTVDNAVIDWDKFVEGVRRQPRGDNFDFSEFESIIGVVCAPFVPYSSAANTLRTVAEGLHACASALELRDWLARPAP
jgi:hypothetical protein